MGDELSRDLDWIQWGIAGRPRQGNEESGDRCLIHPFPGGALVAVVDGLGHGDKAAEAARLAICTLVEGAHQPLDLLFQRCHTALAASRGVVMSLASFQPADGTMTWLGVGNVTGVLRRSSPGAGPIYDWLLLRGGIVGRRLPALQPRTIHLAPGDAMILATDGVGTGFIQDLDWHAPPQKIADTILNCNGQISDDALAVVVRYAGLGRPLRRL